MRSVRRTTAILLAAALAAGCSADSYQKSADRQVHSIVRDRERRTLGYEPQVDASVSPEAKAKPGPEAYEKVPGTPKPPPTTSPIEPSDGGGVPYGKLGPEQLFPSGVSAPQANPENDQFGIAEAERREAQRLALGPPAPMKFQPVRLDLFGALKYGVAHSRDYRARMEDLYLAALDVTLQRHLFEPRPFARTGLRYTGAQESGDYAAALSAVNAVGVRQQLPYGGELAAQATVDFVRAISGNAQNAEPAGVTLSASIPLLRGAGLINLEPLISSEREMVYEVRQFEEFRRDFSVNVSSSYFKLLASQQAISNRAANLQSFQRLTERTQALFDAQRVNYIDVQRALQEQLQAEQDLIVAQANYRRALDDFKLQLGMPIDQPVEVVPQELAVSIPQFQEREAAELAQQFRLDLRTSADRVEDAQRNVQVAKNGLLPDLDVAADARFGNRSGAPASRLNNDESTYSASIALDLPLDRVQERNAFRRSLIQFERANRNYDQLRDQVAADARDALRQIQSAQISLELQRRGIELARLRLENANELLRQGKKDSQDVVDAQIALLRAQDAYEQANATLQIQVLSFLRDTGTLRLDPDSGSIGAALDRRNAESVTR
jgi:hypothetical protein